MKEVEIYCGHEDIWRVEVEAEVILISVNDKSEKDKPHLPLAEEKSFWATLSVEKDDQNRENLQVD